MQPLPPPLHWRDVRPDDAPFLDALFLASREDLRHVAVDPAFVQQLVRMQQQVQETGLRQAYPDAMRRLIERGDDPVGQVTVVLGARELRLLDIAVAPAARRGGVARCVVSHLQREAAARGVPMGLTVAASNTAARGLYLALGFSVVSDNLVVQHMAWRPEGAA
jgi:ribosomal protein S18 acetylase RimI-like enzyme